MLQQLIPVQGSTVQKYYSKRIRKQLNNAVSFATDSPRAVPWQKYSTEGDAAKRNRGEIGGTSRA